MSEPLLPAVEMEPAAGESADSAILWLHGLGADGHDFAPLFEQFQLPRTRVVLPHAPSIPVTLNGGMRMPAWYDIKSLDRNDPPDLAGIRASAARVGALIDREIERGIPAERIVVGGFSQGGAVSLWAGPRDARRLAGIAGLSTYLVDRESLEAELHAANRATPVYIAHGTFDPVVPFSYGKASADHFKSLGYDLTWHETAIDHGVSQEESQNLLRWLQARLG